MANGNGEVTPNGLWQVVDRNVGTEVTPGGQFRDVVNLIIETASGMQFPLKIPMQQFSNDAVVAMANAWSEEFERTAALGKPGG